MKKTVGILFGGKSTEHEISIISARNVYKNLDRELFRPVLMYINPDGAWFITDEMEFLSGKINSQKENGLMLDLSSEDGKWITKDGNIIKPDVIFPVLHGPNGEDGSMQGLIKVAGIPFVGSDVLGSAIAMDKEIAKKLFILENIPVAAYICLRKNELADTSLIIKKLGLPVVIKPANAGSSVGISKAETPEELSSGIEKAFCYDQKVIVEEYIRGREIECAVLGNHELNASVPGEIITEFYDYEAKYLSDTKARLSAPAKLDQDTIVMVKEMAIKAYKTLSCEGMSRVDFFLAGKKLIINEINTIPGFTNISMYPKLFELSGISNKELITRLVELALSRHEENEKLKTKFHS